MMDIVVCMKQTPDTAAVITIKEGENTILSDGVDYIINPYDEFAIEEALRIKEKFNGTVTVVSVGSKRVSKALRTCLAMGADEAVHLVSNSDELSTNYSAAKIMADHIGSLPFNIILCGKQAVDTDTSQVGQMIAEFLDIPHIGTVTKLLLDDKGGVTAHMEQEGGDLVMNSITPVLITCQKGLNEPRLPSLKGIMTAKRKEIKSIEVNSRDDGAVKKLKIIKLSKPPERSAGKIIQEPTIEESVEKLADLLRNEKKVL